MGSFIVLNDRQMDSWMDGQLDGWTVGWMDRLTVEWTFGQND